MQHAIDAVEERGVGSNGTFGHHLQPAVRPDAGGGGEVMAELGDVTTTLAKSWIGERRILEPEGCRGIHELRQHRDADTHADGERAGVEVALYDGVIEPLHSGLAGGGETRDAN